MELRTDLLIDMSSDKDDRKCQSIYCKRKRSRRRRTTSDTMSKNFICNISFSLSIYLFIIILIASKRWDINLTLQLIRHEKWKTVITFMSEVYLVFQYRFVIFRTMLFSHNLIIIMNCLGSSQCNRLMWEKINPFRNDNNLAWNASLLFQPKNKSNVIRF